MDTPRTSHPLVSPWREGVVSFWDGCSGLPLAILRSFEAFLGGCCHTRTKEGLHAFILSSACRRCYVSPVPQRLSPDGRLAVPRRPNDDAHRADPGGGEGLVRHPPRRCLFGAAHPAGLHHPSGVPSEVLPSPLRTATPPPPHSRTPP